MELIYDQKAEAWKEAKYSVTIYFDSEERMNKFIAEMEEKYGKRNRW